MFSVSCRGPCCSFLYKSIIWIFLPTAPGMSRLEGASSVSSLASRPYRFASLFRLRFFTRGASASCLCSCVSCSPAHSPAPPPKPALSARQAAAYAPSEPVLGPLRWRHTSPSLPPALLWVRRVQPAVCTVWNSFVSLL